MEYNVKKYLNKVINHMVRGTKIDYDNDRIRYPYGGLSTTIKGFTIDPFHWSRHCKNVYGLNIDEVNYVWNEYKDIIKDKIENGGH